MMKVGPIEVNKTYPEPEDVRLLESATTNLRDTLLIRVMFRLGCRVSEVLALKVEDIDFTQHTVTIQHLKTHSKISCQNCGAPLSKSHVFCPRCGLKVKDVIAHDPQRRRIRTLPIDAETLHMLEDYIHWGGPVSRHGERFIFGINRHRAWQIVRDCAERAGLSPLVNSETGRIRGISPHRLRDAFAIQAMKTDDSGDGLRLLQEHLGHASFNTTAKYRKVAGKEQREWYDKLWSKEA